MKRFGFLLAILVLVLSTTMANATVIRGVGGAARFRGRFVINGGGVAFLPQQQVIVQQQPLLIQQQPLLMQQSFGLESFGAVSPIVADPFLGVGGFGLNGIGFGRGIGINRGLGGRGLYGLGGLGVGARGLGFRGLRR